MTVRRLTRRLSRRVLLQGVAAVPALLAGANRAAAQIKISQSAAGYQDHPNGGRRCALCAHFQQPNSCQLISGRISPDGWCRVFAPLSGQAAASGPVQRA
jgi:hypothetical protein